MAQTTATRVPKYRLHKPSGLGVVRLGGRDVYLGRHGTPESHAEYRRIIAEWLGAGHPRVASTASGHAVGISVNELVVAYLEFAKTYYVKHGRPTGELACLRHAIKPMVILYGGTRPAEFGPVALKTVRRAMIDADLSRSVVNNRVNRIRRVFKWGVENELVPASALVGLQSVMPLKQGRCDAREMEPVTPVPAPVVAATIEAAPRMIGAMIELQRLTGMRPGEVVIMRTGDLDTSGQVWEYRPAHHKTEHHGRGRVVYLGPQAQAVLAPFLKADLAAFVFSPLEVGVERSRRRRTARITPLTPSQLGRRRKDCPKRTPGQRYTTSSYARAIAYACDAAFPHPEFARVWQSRLTPGQRERLRQWRKDHRWSPNQLRHNAATNLRKRFGIEAARVVLGHSSTDVTEIYAERDLSRAAEIMGQVG